MNTIKILLVMNFSNPQSPLTSTGAVEYYRLSIPFINLAKTYGYTINVVNEITENIDLTGYRGVVFSRMLSIAGRDKEVLELLEKANLPYVLDIDDYWKLPTGHLLYGQWKQNDVGTRIEFAIKNATAVLTTTRELANRIAEINPNVTIAVNAIDPGQPQFNPMETKSPTVRIGWLGGVAHTEDMPVLRAGMRMLHNDHELLGRYAVYCAGYNPVNADIWNYYRFCLTSKTQGGEQGFKFLPSTSIDAFANYYNFFDICLAPLADTSFNRCKSELKLIEAGHFGIPVVASKVYPYWQEKLKDAVFFAGNDKQWHNHLKALVKSSKLRKEYGQRLKEVVSKHYRLDKANEVRHNAIKNVSQ